MTVVDIEEKARQEPDTKGGGNARKEGALHCLKCYGWRSEELLLDFSARRRVVEK